jgi:hypothetical protein
MVASTDFEALFFAARQDSESLIRKELRKGAGINYIGPGGQTPPPLMHAMLSPPDACYAVLKGRETSAQVLLSKSADVTIGDYWRKGWIYFYARSRLSGAICDCQAIVGSWSISLSSTR